MWRLVFAVVLVVGTAGAWAGSALGWGLPSMMKKPVSIRQDSTRSGGHRGPYLLYFGAMGRSHSGGGFRGGK